MITVYNEKIDRRKNYYLTFDVETANGLIDPLVYDIGGAVHDKQGRIYETFSFIVKEVFIDESNLMDSAYYSQKIPEYWHDIRQGNRTIVPYYQIRQHIYHLDEKYNLTALVAHNAFFDYKATATTQRWLTKSKYRWFLPYGIPIYDTLRMAHDTVTQQPSYILWCQRYGFMIDETRPRATAEILYRYMIGDPYYQEAHTGLEDVYIQIEIFTWCTRQNKRMNKYLFNRQAQ